MKSGTVKSRRPSVLIMKYSVDSAEDKPLFLQLLLQLLYAFVGSLTNYISCVYWMPGIWDTVMRSEAARVSMSTESAV